MRFFSVLLIALLLSAGVRGVQDVANTPHNLSVSGPGTIKSATVDEVCVFCHTPHAGQPNTPLWNRALPNGESYLPYQSSTVNAVPKPGRPTGKSLLCLGCHDGTVALGALRKPPRGRPMDLAGTFLRPKDRGFVGTDLSDDHPVSFRYDSALAQADEHLAHPATIGLPLENDELQCTTCHDAHEAEVVPFLRQTSLNGELCRACHVGTPGSAWDWDTSDHATSTKGPSGANPWGNRRPEWRGATVAQNACFNCHTAHGARAPRGLLKGDQEQMCNACHNGLVAKDIQADVRKLHRHPVEDALSRRHDAASVEDPVTMPIHAKCADCHNPHSGQDDVPMIAFDPRAPFTAPHTTPPNANDRIRWVSGIDVNGNPVAADPGVSFQYELCFKCHGRPAKGPCADGSSTRRCSTAEGFRMTRQDGVYNIRDKVYSGTPGLVSYHPIESNNGGNDAEVPSLRTDIPLNRSTSLIYCTDCHSSDTSPAAGRAGPAGGHGSDWTGLLAQEYTFVPETNFSASSYDLCFKCHDQTRLLSNASGFPHDRHLSSGRTSCINCHDPHGSHRYQHLINFLTHAEVGGTVYDITGISSGACAEPLWEDKGVYQGACWLNCHGVSHDPKIYGLSGLPPLDPCP